MEHHTTYIYCVYRFLLLPDFAFQEIKTLHINRAPTIKNHGSSLYSSTIFSEACGCDGVVKFGTTVVIIQGFPIPQLGWVRGLESFLVHADQKNQVFLQKAR